MGVEEAQSLQDVQRFFMIMSPNSRPDAAPHRLIVIRKKRLPNPERHERFFGFVLATAQKVKSTQVLHRLHAEVARRLVT